MNGTVLVRAPSSRLAEGIVTHISRSPVDVALARAQHAAYADVLAASGWVIGQVPTAEDCPDSENSYGELKARPRGASFILAPVPPNWRARNSSRS